MTEPHVTASSHPDVAKRHGLTEWDRARGQWVKPAEETAVRNPFADDDTPDPDSTGYEKLTKRELVAELEKRKDAAGDPLVFDRQARNDVLIDQLKSNDQYRNES